MNPSSSNRRTIVTLVCAVILVCLVYFTAKDRARLSIAEQVAREVFSPISKVASRIGGGISSWASFIVSLGDVKKENEDLHAEVEQLRLENMQLAEAERENERLTALLDMKSTIHCRSVAARVSYRNASNWLSEVVLDKGSDQGLANGMAVVTEQGVVGRTTSVTPRTATVLLALDSRSAIGGLDARSRDVLVVEGLGDGAGVLKARPLGSDCDIQVGDAVVTSGLGGVYPKGYVVGDIISVEQGNYGVSRVAYVRPRVDFERLSEVLVIQDSAEGMDH